MQKGDDPGKFRQLDEILFINDYPGYQQLFSIAKDCMEVVCESKGFLLPAYSCEHLFENNSKMLSFKSFCHVSFRICYRERDLLFFFFSIKYLIINLIVACD